MSITIFSKWISCSRSFRPGDISTTMNICAHLDTTAKDVSAAAMSQTLSLPDWGGGFGWQRN